MTYPRIDDDLAGEVLVLRDDRLWFLREDGDGTAELRVTAGPGPFEQRREVVATGAYEDLRVRLVDGPGVVS